MCGARGAGLVEEIAKSNSTVSQSPVGCRLGKTCGLGALKIPPETLSARACFAVHDRGGNRQLRARPIFQKKVKAHGLSDTLDNLKVKMSALSESLVLLILLPCLFVAKATNTSKPNIIILLADDIGK